MNREDLIGSAMVFTAPSTMSAEEFEKKIDAVGSRLNGSLRARSDLERLIGPDNGAMMENNTRNFLRFMASLFRHYEPAIFVETALWAFRTYRAHGFQIGYWSANLDTLVGILKDELTEPAYCEVYPFFAWLIVQIPAFTTVNDEALAAGPGTPPHGR